MQVQAPERMNYHSFINCGSNGIKKGLKVKLGYYDVLFTLQNLVDQMPNFISFHAVKPRRSDARFHLV